VENGGGLARTAAEDVILMQTGLDPREGRSMSMAWQIRKRSHEAKTVVRRDELGGDAVQSGQGGFLLVRAEMFGRPGFGIACAWAEEVQP
jgi:hypothetical protein